MSCDIIRSSILAKDNAQFIVLFMVAAARRGRLGGVRRLIRRKAPGAPV